MRNFKQPGDVMTFTAPVGGVVSGSPYMIGDLLVIAAGTAAADAEFEGQITGVFEVPKTSAQAWAEGDPIYYDEATAKFDNSGAIGSLVGAAGEVAANPSALGIVRLNGTISEANAPVLPSATVAATGTNQATAAQLADGFVLVSAADATKGVKLPAAAAGRQVHVKNGANAALPVYPATGDAINAIAVNSPITMGALTSATFTAYDATTWYTNPLVPS